MILPIEPIGSVLLWDRLMAGHTDDAGSSESATGKSVNKVWVQLYILRDRLMVGQRTLNPSILVRFQAPQPSRASTRRVVLDAFRVHNNNEFKMGIRLYLN